MKRYLGISFACFCSLLLVAAVASAKPAAQTHQFSEPQIDIDIIGDVDGTNPAPQKVLQDTVWIAEWTYDTGAPCDFTGWEKVDAYVANDGVTYWDIDGTFGGVGAIAGNAAALGYENDLCCEAPNGYDNGWYQAIRIEYAGAADISFDYMVDSEGGFDFLQVEEDSACASFDRVDFAVDPSSPAAAYRTVLFSDSGDVTAGGAVSALGLTDFGGGTHCVYIAFFADGAFAPCDGLQPTLTGKAMVVDNIVINDGGGTRSEDFTDGTLDIGTFVNITDSTPFGPTDPGRDGSWARTFDHITDNDVCTENTSCAILWTDDTTPSIANDASMAFAPGGFVVKNWLDDRIISPWVDLSTTPTATGTIVQFRRFPGNFFSTSRMVQNWSIRGKVDTDDGMGGTIECISGWGHSFQWNSLSFFGWITPTASGNPPASGYDASADFDPTSKELQVRHRTSDWQVIVGAPPPANFIPGPGPYVDKTRIGRQVLSGPVIDEGIDARQQGQDAYATQISTAVTPGTGDHYEPTTDRFGTVAFSRGTELGINNGSPNIITGDSVSVEVQDVRGAGGIVRIELHGAIVSGPHAGLAPPPATVGANGFFVIAGDSARATNGTVVADNFFADIDDEYLVGGDVLQYFWLAEDALGGFTSDPVGLSGVPASVADAQSATNGMFEVNALPAIDWDPDFLAAVGASNKVDPNSDPAFLDESTQKNCILYVNRINSRRRSGDVNRTSFMYTLDRLGYRDSYDVYDHTGMGNTNNHLGGRATVQQAQGYNLIVYDAGNVGPGGTIMPDGNDLDAEKVDQAGWFVSWLAQASTSEAGFATLWVVGSNVLEEKPTNALYTTNMGTTLASTDQGLNANPDALGQTSFTFDVGAGSNNVDFTTGEKADYSLNGGCPVIRNYDGQQSGGTGVNVYLYADPNSGTTGDAAVVMNSNAAANNNTVLMSHPYFDIREDFGGTPTALTSGEDLVKAVLEGVLPTACVETEDPTDTGDDTEIDGTVPVKTALFQNRPNPFNPMTTISFDLAQSGHVSLKIYDVAGRLVRTLIDEKMTAGRNLQRVWDGMDEGGQRVSSGVYFYQLQAPNFFGTDKMVMMK